MKVTTIPLLETGYFGGLTKAYLNNEESLSSFYNHYFDLENFEKAIEERMHFDTDRAKLSEVLREQHVSFFEELPGLEANINLLNDKHTFTVTTGHQICLATGPLYFIYKIASAIHLCRKLKVKYPSYNFIPVYWMATEDHDFEEINHIHLFNKKISWNIATQGATGRIQMSDIQPFLNEIREIIGDKISETNAFEAVLKAYENNTNLAEATRSLVLRLFGDKGLLVLDADHASLKQSFKDIIKKDIIEQVSFEAVSSTITQLVSLNLIKEEKIQVKPRNINFFYLKDNLRNRIILQDGVYSVKETAITFTAQQLLQEIEEFPERFSPNVIMRPVYQERILPNLVYIGGAGELSYWFELKKVFEAHQVFFPMLALRNSFLWIDSKQAEKLMQLGIANSEIFESVDVLTAKILKHIGIAELQFGDEQVMVSTLFDQLKTKISAVDSTLGATVEAEKHKVLKSLEVLEQKTAKAQKNKHEISLNQLKKIKENLFPEGGLQERYENILWLNMKFGNDLIEQLIELASIDKKEFIIITA